MMGDDATRGLIESLQGGGPAGGLCAHWFRADGLVAACQASATEAYMVWHQRGCTATLDTDFPLPPAPLSAAIGAFIRAGHYPDGFLLSPPELRAALRPDCVDFFHSPPDSQLQSMVAANRIYAALLSVEVARKVGSTPSIAQGWRPISASIQPSSIATHGSGIE